MSDEGVIEADLREAALWLICYSEAVPEKVGGTLRTAITVVKAVYEKHPGLLSEALASFDEFKKDWS